MDTHLDDASSTAAVLSYNDSIQTDDATSMASTSLDPDGGRSLADRISHTKVYLLSDASKTRGGKVRGQHVYAT